MKRQIYAAAIHFSYHYEKNTPEAAKKTPRIVIHEYPSVKKDNCRPVNQGMNLFFLFFSIAVCAYHA